MRSDINSLVSIIYLVFWIFFGNFILLNLFLAILLEGFSIEESKKSLLNNNDEYIDDTIDIPEKESPKRGTAINLKD